MSYMYMYTVLTISTWNYFHNYIKEFTNVLGKNQFPSSLVNRTVKQCLSKILASTLHASTTPTSSSFAFASEDGFWSSKTCIANLKLCVSTSRLFHDCY